VEGLLQLWQPLLALVWERSSLVAVRVSEMSSLLRGFPQTGLHKPKAVRISYSLNLINFYLYLSSYSEFQGGHLEISPEIAIITETHERFLNNFFQIRIIKKLKKNDCTVLRFIV
jgi:hypothetical protein